MVEKKLNHFLFPESHLDAQNYSKYRETILPFAIF